MYVLCRTSILNFHETIIRYPYIICKMDSLYNVEMHIHIPVLTGILMQIIVYFEILFIFIIVFSLFVHFPNVLLHMYI